MGPNLPSEQELRRWIGENVALLVIPHDCFLSNKSNCPVIAKSHKAALHKFVQYTKCHLAIEPNGDVEDTRLNLYSDYLDFVRSNMIECNESSGHEDNLKFPLQPLCDDLGTGVYEVIVMKLISNSKVVNSYL